jgi:hypothetical protein
MDARGFEAILGVLATRRSPEWLVISGRSPLELIGGPRATRSDRGSPSRHLRGPQQRAISAPSRAETYRARFTLASCEDATQDSRVRARSRAMVALRERWSRYARKWRLSACDDFHRPMTKDPPRLLRFAACWQPTDSSAHDVGRRYQMSAAPRLDGQEPSGARRCRARRRSAHEQRWA